MDFMNLTLKLTACPAAAKKYAGHLAELLDAVDENKISPEYQRAVMEKDCAGAVHALADYYRAKPDFSVPELSGRGKYDPELAEKTLNGIARVVNVDWTFPGGEVDFLFNPTVENGPTNHEWLWQFNRHGEWMNLARGYRATGDERYLACFEKQLLKWIAQTDVPENWNGPGSAWRTIECGIRLLGSWQATYDGFRADMSDMTLLLMIASMHRQVLHLIAHPTKANWLMMEMNGVYTFSALFPELKDSEENRAIAADYLLKELKAQILPDGMHNELSPDYQSVVFHCAWNFCNLAANLGYEVPEEFKTLIGKTVDAAIRLSTPAFTQPRTNDTYTILTRIFTEDAERLLGGRPEYLFVNTNRAEGAPPEGETASAYLPWAGFAAMRADWSDDAAYLCFDVGPLGRAHIHQDKLNINLFKGDEELIYDDGGGQYEVSRAREYGLSGYAHNTVLVDGKAQHRSEPLEATEPIDAGWITNEKLDYVCGMYEDAFGHGGEKPAAHTREVCFIKPDFFCVVDTLCSRDGKPHDYEVLFHLDTTKVKKLEEYPNAVMSDYGRKYEVAMIPLDDPAVVSELKIVSAVTEPQMQGWYNGRNEQNLHEAICVSREVKGVRDYRFVTLLFPMGGGQALPKIEAAPNGEIRVMFNGKEHTLDLNRLNG